MTHFEREDFTAPPPNGFGMDADDPNLDKIWGFVEELQKFEGKGGEGNADAKPVVDDQMSEADLIEETIRKEGWTKHIARNGKE